MPVFRFYVKASGSLKEVGSHDGKTNKVALDRFLNTSAGEKVAKANNEFIVIADSNIRTITIEEEVVTKPRRTLKVSGSGNRGRPKGSGKKSTAKKSTTKKSSKKSAANKDEASAAISEAS